MLCICAASRKILTLAMFSCLMPFFLSLMDLKGKRRGGESGNLVHPPNDRDNQRQERHSSGLPRGSLSHCLLPSRHICRKPHQQQSSQSSNPLPHWMPAPQAGTSPLSHFMPRGPGGEGDTPMSHFSEAQCGGRHGHGAGTLPGGRTSPLPAPSPPVQTHL